LPVPATMSSSTTAATNAMSKPLERRICPP
jgi:hypothetical protein